MKFFGFIFVLLSFHCITISQGAVGFDRFVKHLTTSTSTVISFTDINLANSITNGFDSTDSLLDDDPSIYGSQYIETVSIFNGAVHVITDALSFSVKKIAAATVPLREVNGSPSDILNHIEAVLDQIFTEIYQSIKAVEHPFKLSTTVRDSLGAVMLGLKGVVDGVRKLVQTTLVSTITTISSNNIQTVEGSAIELAKNVEKLNAAIAHTSDIAGMSLLEFVAGLAILQGGLVQIVFNVFAGIADLIRILSGTPSQILSTLTGAIAVSLSGVINILSQVNRGITTRFYIQLNAAIQTINTTFTNSLNNLLNALGSIAGTIFGRLSNILYGLGNGALSMESSAFYVAVESIFKITITLTTVTSTTVTTVLQTLFTTVKNAFISITKTVESIVTSGGRALLATMTPVGQAFLTLFAKVENLINSISSHAQNLNTKTIEQIEKATIEVVNSLGVLIVASTKATNSLLSSTINTIIAKLVSSISIGLTSVVQIIYNIISGVVLIIQELAHISSHIIISLASTISTILTSLTKTISGLSVAITSNLNNLKTFFGDVSSTLTSISSTVTTGISSITTTVTEVIRGAAGLLSSILSRLTTGIVGVTANSANRIILNISTISEKLVVATATNVKSILESYKSTITITFRSIIHIILKLVNLADKPLHTLIHNVETTTLNVQLTSTKLTELLITFSSTGLNKSNIEQIEILITDLVKAAGELSTSINIVINAPVTMITDEIARIQASLTVVLGTIYKIVLTIIETVNILVKNFYGVPSDIINTLSTVISSTLDSFNLLLKEISSVFIQSSGSFSTIVSTLQTKLTTITTTLTKTIENTTSKVTALSNVYNNLSTTVIGTAITGVTETVSNVLNITNTLANATVQTAEVILTNLQSSLNVYFESISKSLPNVFIEVSALIPILINQFSSNLFNVKDRMSGLISAILSQISASTSDVDVIAVETAVGYLTASISQLTAAVSQISQAAAAAITIIAAKVVSSVLVIYGTILQIVYNTVYALNSLLHIVTGNQSEILKSLLTSLLDTIGGVSSLLSVVAGVLSGTIAEITTFITRVNTVVATITTTITTIITKFSNTLGSKVIQVRGSFGSVLSSLLFGPIGSLVVSINTSLTAVETTTTSLLSETIQTSTNALAKLSSTVSLVFKNVIDSVKQATDNSYISSTLVVIHSTLEQLISTIKSQTSITITSTEINVLEIDFLSVVKAFIEFSVSVSNVIQTAVLTTTENVGRLIASMIVVLTTVLQIVYRIISSIVTLFKLNTNVFSGILSGLTEFVDTVTNVLSDTSNIFNGALNVVTKVITNISTIVTKVTITFQTKITSMTETVTSRSISVTGDLGSIYSKLLFTPLRSIISSINPTVTIMQKEIVLIANATPQSAKELLDKFEQVLSVNFNKLIDFLNQLHSGASVDGNPILTKLVAAFNDVLFHLKSVVSKVGTATKETLNVTEAEVVKVFHSISTIITLFGLLVDSAVTSVTQELLRLILSVGAILGSAFQVVYDTLSALSSVLKTITGLVSKVIYDFLSPLSTVATSITTLLGNASPVLQGSTADIYTVVSQFSVSFKVTITSVTIAFTKLSEAVVSAAVTISGEFGSALAKLLFTPIGYIVFNINTYVTTTQKEIVLIANATPQSAKELLVKFEQVLSVNFNKLIDFLNQLHSGASVDGNTILTKLVAAFNDVLFHLKSVVSKVGTATKETLNVTEAEVVKVFHSISTIITLFGLLVDSAVTSVTQELLRLILSVGAILGSAFQVVYDTLSALSSVLKTITGLVSKVIYDFLSPLSTVATSITTLLGNASPVLQGSTADIYTVVSQFSVSFKVTITSVTIAFTKLSEAVVSAAVTISGEFGSALAKLLFTPIGYIVFNINTYVTTTQKEIVLIANATPQSAKELLDKFEQVLSVNFNKLIDFLNQLHSGASVDGNPILTKLVAAFNDVLFHLKSVVSKVGTATKETLNVTEAEVVKVFHSISTIITLFGLLVDSAVTSVTQELLRLILSVGAILGSAFQVVYDTLSALSSVLKTITGLVSKVIYDFLSPLSTVATSITTLLGNASPVLQGSTADIYTVVSQFSVSFKVTITSVTIAFTKLSEAVVSAAVTISGEFGSALAKLLFTPIGYIVFNINTYVTTTQKEIVLIANATPQSAKELLDKFEQVLSVNFNKLIDFLNQLHSGASVDGNPILTKLVAAFNDVLFHLKSVVSKVGTATKETLNVTEAEVVKVFHSISTIITLFGLLVDSAVTSVTQELLRLILSVGAILGSAFQVVYDTLSALSSVLKTITGLVSKVIYDFLSPLSTVATSITTLLGNASPVLQGSTADIYTVVSQFSVSFKVTITSVTIAFTKLSEAVVSAAVTISGEFGSALAKLLFTPIGYIVFNINTYVTTTQKEIVLIANATPQSAKELLDKFEQVLSVNFNKLIDFLNQLHSGVSVDGNPILTKLVAAFNDVLFHLKSVVSKVGTATKETLNVTEAEVVKVFHSISTIITLFGLLVDSAVTSVTQELLKLILSVGAILGSAFQVVYDTLSALSSVLKTITGLVSKVIYDFLSPLSTVATSITTLLGNASPVLQGSTADIYTVVSQFSVSFKVTITSVTIAFTKLSEAVVSAAVTISGEFGSALAKLLFTPIGYIVFNINTYVTTTQKEIVLIANATPQSAKELLDKFEQVLSVNFNKLIDFLNQLHSGASVDGNPILTKLVAAFNDVLFHLKSVVSKVGTATKETLNVTEAEVVKVFHSISTIITLFGLLVDSAVTSVTQELLRLILSVGAILGSAFQVVYDTLSALSSVLKTITGLVSKVIYDFLSPLSTVATSITTLLGNASPVLQGSTADIYTVVSQFSVSFKVTITSVTIAFTKLSEAVVSAAVTISGEFGSALAKLLFTPIGYIVFNINTYVTTTQKEIVLIANATPQSAKELLDKFEQVLSVNFNKLIDFLNQLHSGASVDGNPILTKLVAAFNDVLFHLKSVVSKVGTATKETLNVTEAEVVKVFHSISTIITLFGLLVDSAVTSVTQELLRLILSVGAILGSAFQVVYDTLSALSSVLKTITGLVSKVIYDFLSPLSTVATSITTLLGNASPVLQGSTADIYTVVSQFSVSFKVTITSVTIAFTKLSEAVVSAAVTISGEFGSALAKLLFTPIGYIVFNINTYVTTTQKEIVLIANATPQSAKELLDKFEQVLSVNFNKLIDFLNQLHSGASVDGNPILTKLVAAFNDVLFHLKSVVSKVGTATKETLNVTEAEVVKVFHSISTIITLFGLLVDSAVTSVTQELLRLILSVGAILGSAFQVVYDTLSALSSVLKTITGLVSKVIYDFLSPLSTVATSITTLLGNASPVLQGSTADIYTVVSQFSVSFKVTITSVTIAFTKLSEAVVSAAVTISGEFGSALAKLLFTPIGYIVFNINTYVTTTQKEIVLIANATPQSAKELLDKFEQVLSVNFNKLIDFLNQLHSGASVDGNPILTKLVAAFNDVLFHLKSVVSKVGTATKETLNVTEAEVVKVFHSISTIITLFGLLVDSAVTSVTQELLRLILSVGAILGSAFQVVYDTLSALSSVLKTITGLVSKVIYDFLSPLSTVATSITTLLGNASPVLQGSTADIYTVVSQFSVSFKVTITSVTIAFTKLSEAVVSAAVTISGEFGSALAKLLFTPIGYIVFNINTYVTTTQKEIVLIANATPQSAKELLDKFEQVLSVNFNKLIDFLNQLHSGASVDGNPILTKLVAAFNDVLFHLKSVVSKVGTATKETLNVTEAEVVKVFHSISTIITLFGLLVDSAVTSVTQELLRLILSVGAILGSAFQVVYDTLSALSSVLKTITGLVSKVIYDFLSPLSTVATSITTLLGNASPVLQGSTADIYTVVSQFSVSFKVTITSVTIAFTKLSEAVVSAAVTISGEFGSALAKLLFTPIGYIVFNINTYVTTTQKEIVLIANATPQSAKELLDKFEQVLSVNFNKLIDFLNQLHPGASVDGNPILTKLVAAFNDVLFHLKSVVSKVGTATKETLNVTEAEVVKVFHSISTIITLFGLLVDSAVTSVTQELLRLILSVGAILGSAFQVVYDTLSALSSVLKTITGLVSKVIYDFLSPLSTVATSITTLLGNASPVLQGSTADIYTVVSQFSVSFKVTITSVTIAFTKLSEAVVSAAVTISGEFGSALAKLLFTPIGYIVFNINTYVTTTQKEIVLIANATPQSAKELLDKFEQVLSVNFNKLIDFLNQLHSGASVDGNPILTKLVAAFNDVLFHLKSVVSKVGTATKETLNVTEAEVVKVFHSISTIITLFGLLVDSAVTSVTQELLRLILSVGAILGSAFQVVYDTLSALSSVLKTITGLVSKVIYDFLSPLSTVATSITTLLGNASPVLQGSTADIYTVVSQFSVSFKVTITTFTTIVTKITDAIISVVVSVSGELGSALSSLLFGPVGAIVISLSSSVNFVQSGISKVSTAITQSATQALNNFLTLLSSEFAVINNILKEVLSISTDSLKIVFTQFIYSFNNVLSNLTSFVNAIITNSVIQIVETAAIKLFTSINSLISDYGGLVKSTLSIVKEEIVKMVVSVSIILSSVFHILFETVTMLNNLLKNVFGVMSKIIEDFLPTLFTLSASISTVLNKVSASILRGDVTAMTLFLQNLNVGIKVTITNLNTVINALSQLLVSTVITVTGSLGSLLSQLLFSSVGTVVVTISSSVTNVQNVANTITSATKSTADSVLSKLYDSMSESFKSVNTILPPIFAEISGLEELATGISNVKSVIKSVITVILTDIGTKLTLSTIESAVVELATSTNTLSIIFAKLISNVSVIQKTAATFVTSVTLIFINVLQILYTFVYSIEIILKIISGSVSDLINKLTTTLQNIINNVTGVLSNASTILTGTTNSLNNFVSNVSSTLNDVTTTLGSTVKTMAELLSSILGNAGWFWNLLSGNTHGSAGTAISTVSIIINNIEKVTVEFKNVTLANVTSLLTNLMNAIDKAFEVIFSSTSKIVSTAYKSLSNELETVSTSLNNVQSLTKVYVNLVVTYVSSGTINLEFKNSMETETIKLASAILQVSTTIINATTAALQIVNDENKQLVTLLLVAFGTLIKVIIETITSISIVVERLSLVASITINNVLSGLANILTEVNSLVSGVFNPKTDVQKIFDKVILTLTTSTSTFTTVVSKVASSSLKFIAGDFGNAISQLAVGPIGDFIISVNSILYNTELSLNSLITANALSAATTTLNLKSSISSVFKSVSELLVNITKSITISTSVIEVFTEVETVTIELISTVNSLVSIPLTDSAIITIEGAIVQVTSVINKFSTVISQVINTLTATITYTITQFISYLTIIFGSILHITYHIIYGFEVIIKTITGNNNNVISQVVQTILTIRNSVNSILAGLSGNVLLGNITQLTSVFQQFVVTITGVITTFSTTVATIVSSTKVVNNAAETLGSAIGEITEGSIGEVASSLTVASSSLNEVFKYLTTITFSNASSYLKKIDNTVHTVFSSIGLTLVKINKSFDVNHIVEKASKSVTTSDIENAASKLVKTVILSISKKLTSPEIDNIEKDIGKLITTVESFVKSISNVAVAAAFTATKDIVNYLAALFILLASVVKIVYNIVLGVSNLVTVLTGKAYTNLEHYADVLRDVLVSATSVVTGISKASSGSFSGLMSFFATIVKAMKDIAETFSSNLSKASNAKGNRFWNRHNH